MPLVGGLVEWALGPAGRNWMSVCTCWKEEIWDHLSRDQKADFRTSAAVKTGMTFARVGGGAVMNANPLNSAINLGLNLDRGETITGDQITPGEAVKQFFISLGFQGAAVAAGYGASAGKSMTTTPAPRPVVPLTVIAEAQRFAGESPFFRGTSEGFAGGATQVKLGLTPTSTDPARATLFATESEAYGKGLLHIARKSDLAGIQVESANVRAALEMEVVFKIQPAEFAQRASITITAAEARSILGKMGIQVPERLSPADLTRLANELPRMTPLQAREFAEAAAAVKSEGSQVVK